MLGTPAAGNVLITEIGFAPLVAAPADHPLLEVLLHPAAEEAFQWMVSIGDQCNPWRDLGSRAEVVRLLRLIAADGDWLVIQSKDLDRGPSGRYAQVMNTGHGYFVEIAYRDDGAVHNWRIGRGADADDAGNKPHGAVTRIHQLKFAEITEVLDSCLRGHGLPLGYGGALHVYR
ncbi:hypothetical protein C4K88_16290 [Arthrobacter pityocampae]|uniref:Uncharacterized protein n=1 Tax=Arthrobacter pityocampae TaxID=547334 RepID=A0A2S5ITV3_9MICC|nr:hypothetical protein [Arthrobacter pityocampae]PPB48012.1 hypothetical protein C4K88_16290 [Arthrobacter pityocampae]